MLSRLILGFACLFTAGLRAAPSFSRGLSLADFQSAGLGKLTPDELAKLDQLVSSRQTGAVAQATEETTQKVTTTVREQIQAEDRKHPSAGILEKMAVILKPGTQIEYTTLDSTLVSIAEVHRGKGGAVFTLANGQRWATTEDQDWPSTTGKPVHCRIVPGSMGSFFMEIEDAGRPRVRFLGNVLSWATTPKPAPR